ncbi:hypothetical protein OROHE_022193 [Orobanche hederae]
MRSGVKSDDENLVGRRVKVWWPKDKSLQVMGPKVTESQTHGTKSAIISLMHGCCFYTSSKYVVSSHGRSGKNLVGVEESDPVHFSSHTTPEMEGFKDHGKELIGCRVKVWRSKSKMCSEGVVASYDLSHRQHLVVYTDGVEEMMDLRKHREPADAVCSDQVC